MLVDSIRNLIDYLKEDEQKNWEELDKPSNHIYNDIIKVEKWLDGGGELC